MGKHSITFSSSELWTTKRLGLTSDKNNVILQTINLMQNSIYRLNFSAVSAQAYDK